MPLDHLEPKTHKCYKIVGGMLSLFQLVLSAEVLYVCHTLEVQINDFSLKKTLE